MAEERTAETDLTASPLQRGGTMHLQAGAEAEGPTSVEPPSDKVYDPTRDREEMRGKIAIWLVVSLLVLVYSALVITVATAVACAAKDSCSIETSSLASTKVVIEMLLTPLIGLVGAVAGFYFGEKSGKA